MAYKILYVEDEPNLAKIVKESLESRDFEVTMIHDGMNAVETFEACTPDVCILDVMLPNKDGFTIGKEIRTIDTHVPILYLTAKNQTKDVVNGFHAGGNDYIKKPFSMEELIVRINNLMTLTKNHASVVPQTEHIQLGSYLFFPLKYEIHYQQQVQNLSHRESQLLQILAQHKNTAIDRKEILLKIWGDDSFFNSRNLDVYIKKLRNYLQQDEQVKIVTLKGVGYHFVVPK